MSVSIKNVIPEIGHLHFLVLTAFCDSKDDSHLATCFKEIKPATLAKAKQRLTDAGYLRRICFGEYEITPLGINAIEATKEFYKPLVA